MALGALGGGGGLRGGRGRAFPFFLGGGVEGGDWAGEFAYGSVRTSLEFGEFGVVSEEMEGACTVGKVSDGGFGFVREVKIVAPHSCPGFVGCVGSEG